MSDIAMSRDPNVGRQNFLFDEDGDVVMDDTEEHAVMGVLVEYRAKWWADTEGTHGSRLHTIRHLKRRTPSDAKAYALEALQPLVDAKKITVKSVTARALPNDSAGRFEVTVMWTNVRTTQPKTTKIIV